MPTYFDFEATLDGIDPRIWRRFLLRSDLTFQDLHDSIQSACGWQNYHQFLFFQPASRNDQISLATSCSEASEELYGRRLPLGNELPLVDFFGAGEGKQRGCWYEYDFGDSWMHKIALMQCVDRPEVFVRRLVWGERAFPPEDCGGVPGYERCREFLESGEDPWDEPEGLKEWLRDWNPERFDLNETRKGFDR